MLVTIIVGLVGVAAGFGIGRIKNTSKLTAISTEVSVLESKALSAAGAVKADILDAVAKIKTLLGV